MIDTISTCRGCGSQDLTEVLDLGIQPLSRFPSSGDDPVLKAPLVLLICRYCSLVQLAHTVSPDELYREYYYRSGATSTMRRQLKGILRKTLEFVRLLPADCVLDIGCNDGTLLGLYQDDDIPRVIRVGFEPCSEILAEAIGSGSIDIPHPELFSAARYRESGRRARVITAISMFYDLNQPIEFLREVASCLEDDGVLAIQVNYLYDMLEKNSFDCISHEHLCYYSFTTLREMLLIAGLEVVYAERNDVNGSGILVIACRKEYAPKVPSPFSPEVLLEWEKAKDLRSELGKFSTSIRKIKGVVGSYIGYNLSLGRKLYLLGASTRGLVVVKYCGMSCKNILGASERSRQKVGRFYSDTGIRCVEEEVAREVADVLIALPWQFRDEILQREIDFLARGGRVFFPLPWPEEFSMVESQTHQLLAGRPL